MSDVFIGRHGIYDRKMQIYAYELLFRGSETNAATFQDGDRATTQVMLNTFLEIGLESIVGEHHAFINLTRAFLVGEYPLPFPPHKAGLEVLENIAVNEELVKGVCKLSERGYRIALDDFVFNESLRPLVALADMIKIDILSMDRGAVEEHVKKLRRGNLKLLAEKVETKEDFEFCKKLGFDYFQGYFFCMPNIIKGRHIPDNRLAILHLLGRLMDPETETRELEQIISKDVSLSYKLLRYVNCAQFAFRKKITSIQQAITYLGFQIIRSWAMLLAMASVDDKPHELTVIAMVRAKMCELLAAAMNHPNREGFFTVGLFSVMDAMMDVPMEQVLESLPLSEEIVAALLRFEGVQGEALRCAIAFEHGNHAGAVCDALDHQTIQSSYLKALAWATEADSQLVAA